MGKIISFVKKEAVFFITAVCAIATMLDLHLSRSKSGKIYEARYIGRSAGGKRAAF